MPPQFDTAEVVNAIKRDGFCCIPDIAISNRLAELRNKSVQFDSTDPQGVEFYRDYVLRDVVSNILVVFILLSNVCSEFNQFLHHSSTGVLLATIAASKKTLSTSSNLGEGVQELMSLLYLCGVPIQICRTMPARI